MVERARDRAVLGDEVRADGEPLECPLDLDDGDVIPSGYWFDGTFGDARETRPSEPRADCRCRRHLTLADAAVIPFIP
jgi:hypothetical protein